MSEWFFLSSSELCEGPLVITSQEVLKHFKANRLKKGDHIFLSDGKERVFLSRIERLGPEEAEVFVLQQVKSTNEPPLEVTLFIGILKGDKMDQVIRQAVELGVKKIVPVVMGRTVVKLTEQKKKTRLERWENIALSAASQCMRGFIPEVLLPQSFDQVIESLFHLDLVIVPWEEENKQGLLSLLQNISIPPKYAGLFTGPEGGFSPIEIEKLKGVSAVCPVSLGPRILRAETAPLTVLSVLMGMWGDLGGGAISPPAL